MTLAEQLSTGALAAAECSYQTVITVIDTGIFISMSHPAPTESSPQLNLQHTLLWTQLEKADFSMVVYTINELAKTMERRISQAPHNLPDRRTGDGWTLKGPKEKL